MKLSQILRETKIQQITGDLIRFKQDERTFKPYDEIIGKCALGILACESEDPSMHLNIDKTFVKYWEIIESYGLKDDSVYPKLCDKIGNNPYNWDFDDTANLSTIIIRLNDTYQLKFKEIADFLEVTFDL